MGQPLKNFYASHIEGRIIGFSYFKYVEDFSDARLNRILEKGK